MSLGLLLSGFFYGIQKFALRYLCAINEVMTKSRNIFTVNSGRQVSRFNRFVAISAFVVSFFWILIVRWDIDDPLQGWVIALLATTVLVFLFVRKCPIGVHAWTKPSYVNYVGPSFKRNHRRCVSFLVIGLLPNIITYSG